MAAASAPTQPASPPPPPLPVPALALQPLLAPRSSSPAKTSDAAICSNAAKLPAGTPYLCRDVGGRGTSRSRLQTLVGGP
eukprot:262459-Chlamydomonas_euryale.AAC.1